MLQPDMKLEFGCAPIFTLRLWSLAATIDIKLVVCRHLLFETRFFFLPDDSMPCLHIDSW